MQENSAYTRHDFSLKSGFTKIVLTPDFTKYILSWDFFVIQEDGFRHSLTWLTMSDIGGRGGLANASIG